MISKAYIYEEFGILFLKAEYDNSSVTKSICLQVPQIDIQKLIDALNRYAASGQPDMIKDGLVVKER
jgi:hypothetical protein